ncbi:kinase [Sphingomonas sp.]|uniref:kinase n=1 Tax=Sphingomonas sp. TaxID=28214 RepID=UPI001B2D08EF|nr:kinase [Sphingomonas sp.]MBO9712861.1 kinase [Sphingomonas sp.]
MALTPMALLDRALALAGAEGLHRRPPLIGLAGSQGSGKSTLAKAWAEARGGVAAFSLDDVYLGASARQRLAAEVHPLLRIRGVPGTHDLALLDATLAALAAAGEDDRTPLPAFDKLADDRLPRERWPVFAGRPEIVLIEGWCLGATPQEATALAEPINPLEREQDAEGGWRRWVNDQLAGPYATLFARFDAIALLRAPGFETVVGWRCEQQATLLGRALGEAERAEIAGFVACFERITRHMLAGGVRADVVADLGADRSVVQRR